MHVTTATVKMRRVVEVDIARRVYLFKNFFQYPLSQICPGLLLFYNTAAILDSIVLKKILWDTQGANVHNSLLRIIEDSHRIGKMVYKMNFA